MIARSGPPGPEPGAVPIDPARPGEADGSRVRVVRSADLLGDAGLLHIDHDGEIYSLRRTRNGRLILTK